MVSSQTVPPDECRDWWDVTVEVWGWRWITLQTAEGVSYRERVWVSNRVARNVFTALGMLAELRHPSL